MAKNLAGVLSDFLKVNGVVAAALVGRDGFVIESAASENVNMEALGAMVATAIGTSEALGGEFELGAMSQYLVEFDRGKVVIATAGDDILALFTDATAVIGGVRYAVKKGISELLAAL
ncbi:MAG TPA: dynein regulation protein LC7 [Gammaproteobacteria bacterium]|nr:dynein regulation protein LC7 [Gammaproteobacteria bacterium]